MRLLKPKPLDFVVVSGVALAVLALAWRLKSGLSYEFDWAAMPQYLLRWDPARGRLVANVLLEGFFTTLRLSLWAGILAFWVGLLLGLARTSRRLAFRLSSRLYVELIRNTPPLVLIFIFYFFFGDQLIPALGLGDFIQAQDPRPGWAFRFFLGPPELLARFASGVLTLALIEAAYMAEIVRAGIESVERGQWEAASALGLGRAARMRYVIGPQAAARSLPPLAGQFISLVKDSAIVSVISIPELTFQATELMASTYLTIETWLVVTGMYLALTLGLSLAARALENRLARHYQ